ncbi:MAG: hypothetical protein A3I75_05435 [Deltaproteobacteria bacterium RIFCSPLOWO2_02_FULL_50_16]|nr:MAG: hypothetical protein A2053_01650 [Deltaproteobacteria bacterium GWA2_50_8]OGQ33053.1 MAG: hypothetical protein A3B79_02360 [Deltaproteobacteria bacterium RIFCSPHIGHO2_02_FULL_50_15]OGQ58160.1 MAG: hypothetical protein A3I75_05435 [Deltaproteobacteria bacterium RIFCSPLOWO2_02_FULL_50_16]OGQ66484.1 MAG: hypothetical protein A3F89_05470 [Deltaproteobacteria bacterium RIFCSPLOWO2_12_FULL_50_11]
MVDPVEKFGNSRYRVDGTGESHDEEQRRRQEREEEEKKKKQQKSKFDKNGDPSHLLPSSQGRITNPLLGGRAALKMTEDIEKEVDKGNPARPEEEAEEESMSIRVLKRWKILDAMGGLRPGILLSYLLALSAIITSLFLMIRIILS